MPDYRRLYLPGGTYFFTAVTHERQPILTTDLGRECLRRAIERVRDRRRFEVVAIVLLPDHLHTVWSLPDGDSRYPVRWKRIKEEFTTAFLGDGGPVGPRSPSRQSQGERGVWQRRYWEHAVRDEDDLERCLDYLLYNPVKHGLAAVRDWPWSSFHRFVEAGLYPTDWGAAPPGNLAGAEWDAGGVS